MYSFPFDTHTLRDEAQDLIVSIAPRSHPLYRGLIGGSQGLCVEDSLATLHLTIPEGSTDRANTVSALTDAIGSLDMTTICDHVNVSTSTPTRWVAAHCPS